MEHKTTCLLYFLYKLARFRPRSHLLDTVGIGHLVESNRWNNSTNTCLGIYPQMTCMMTAVSLHLKKRAVLGKRQLVKQRDRQT